MNRKKHRLVAFLAGMVVCLLAMELILRVVGAIYAYRSESDEVIKVPAQCTILCVGDSVTFGLGAPRTQSYPAQLERLLNAKESKRVFTVVNRGRPGQNTSQLIETLEGDIKEVEPSIVLILTGGANLWNYWGYQTYRQQSKFFSSIYNQLYRIRLYKLVRLLFQNIRSKDQHIEPNKHEYIQALEPDEETIDLSEESIAIARDTLNSEVYCAVGAAYMERGDYDQALNWFQEGINIDPTFSQNYERIGWLYYSQKLYKKALPWFMKGLDRNPSDSHCYDGIAQIFTALSLYDEAIDFFRKEKARNPVAKDFLLMFKLKNKRLIERNINRWVQVDIAKIISICAKHNIKIILQNYTREEVVDGVLRKIAYRYDIPFVNHHNAFKEIVEDKLLYEQYFVPDGHPNARGYNLMAKNIFMILKNVLIVND